jgi:ubiquitin C-terminal hydrolase
MAHSFAKLVAQIWTGGKTPIRPSDMRDALGQFAKQFATGDQQDTMEAAQYILDGVHEDFNIPERFTNIEPVFGNGQDDLETSARSWQRHTTRNRSLIVQLFHGLLRSHMQCLECQDVAVVFDPFVTLSLPVTQVHRTSMVVTFVPLRFEEPRRLLELQISSNAPPKDFSEAVSARLGRSVNVVVCGRSFTSPALTWLGGAEVRQGSDEFLAFEINSTSKFYMPCSVQLPPKTDVSGLFLLEFDNQNPSARDIMTKANQVLACAWQPYDGPTRPEVSKLISMVQLPGQGPDRFNVALYGDQVHVDSWVRCCASYVTVLELIATDSNFSLVSLARHYKEAPTIVSHEGDQPISIHQCFEWFTVKDRLGEDNKWYCPHCRIPVTAFKKMDIWTIPRLLILHLKRFNAQQRLGVMVDFPEVLDMKPYVIGPQKDDADLRYKLFAVSNHTGNLVGGHYTADVVVVQPGNTDGTWYNFEDITVKTTTAAAVHSADAYVLYYERIAPSP